MKGNKARRKRKTEADRKQTTPPRVDSIAGLDAAMLTGRARLVGYLYNSRLFVENQRPPAERPTCATTRVSVEDIVRTLRLTRVLVVPKD